MTAQVTVIAGPPRAGKTRRLLAEYLTALARYDAAGCLWLAPSHVAALELRDQLAASASRALLSPGIMTFAELADQIVAAGAHRIRPLSRLQKQFLLRQVVEESVSAGELSLLNSIATTPGFLVQLDHWIADRKRRDEWAEDVTLRAHGPRERELAAVYRRYQRRLADDDFYDAEGLFWAARETLESGPLGPAFEYRLIVVAGFRDFTSAQFDILRLLAQRAAEMQISLSARAEDLSRGPAVDGRGLLFEKVQSTYQRLREIFPEQTVVDLPPSRKVPAWLVHAEAHLFCEASRGPRADAQGLEIIAAGSAQSEAREVARRIKRLLVDGTARPGDIVVVLAPRAEPPQRFAEACDDFGIPWWREAPPRLSQSPLVRTVAELLRLVRDDWPFRDLLTVLGNRLIGIFEQSTADDSRAQLERLVRAAQLPRGQRPLLEQLGRWASDTTPGRQERAQQALAGLTALEPLAAALDRLPQEASIGEWISAIDLMLQELAVVTDDQLGRERNRLQSALASLTTIGSRGATKLDVGQFLQLVELVASDQPLPGVTDSVGRVRILSAETARHTTAAHVFLVGASEQSFSGGRRADELDLAEDAPAAAGDAMALFYSLVTLAGRTLTISYPALDDKGQQLPPSPLVGELRRCFGAGRIHETQLPLGVAASIDDQPYSRSGYRQSAVAQALSSDVAPLAGLAAQPNSLGAGILAAFEAIGSRARREEFGPYEGILVGEAARAALAQVYDASHLWSPSRLESYAACPYRFYADYLLKLEPLDDLALASDAVRRGSLLHFVLATIHAQLIEHAAELDGDEAWQAELAARFGRALDARVQAIPLVGLERSLREIERRQIAAWATDYARQEAAYRQRWADFDEPLRPAHFEVRFGPEVRSDELTATPSASMPVPFEFDLGDEKIRIVGQIDRVDVGRVGEVRVLNIIDYKSGRQVQLKDAHLEAGRQLQLPLYALAAEELLFAAHKSRVLAAGYWSIQGTGFEKGALELLQREGQTLSDANGWPRLRPQLQQTLRRLIAGVRAGQFPVYNEDPHCTRWCPQSTICRIAQIRSLEKVWRPEERAP